jgi:hypothetical protein
VAGYAGSGKYAPEEFRRKEAGAKKNRDQRLRICGLKIRSHEIVVCPRFPVSAVSAVSFSKANAKTTKGAIAPFVVTY